MVGAHCTKANIQQIVRLINWKTKLYLRIENELSGCVRGWNWSDGQKTLSFRWKIETFCLNFFGWKVKGVLIWFFVNPDDICQFEISFFGVNYKSFVHFIQGTGALRTVCFSKSCSIAVKDLKKDPECSYNLPHSWPLIHLCQKIWFQSENWLWSTLTCQNIHHTMYLK